MPDPVLWQRMTRLNDLKLNSGAHAVIKAPLVQGSADIASDDSSRQKITGPAVVAQALTPPSDVGAMDKLPRLGERILMMLVVMGNRPLGDLNPIIISEIVYGLKQAGLLAEARNLALEVAISAGL